MPKMHNNMSELKDDIEIVRSSGLFDSKWYLESYPDVQRVGLDPIEHYLRIGFRMLRNPSLRFDTQSYLASNADVVSAGVNPLVHYIRFGAKENRPAVEPQATSSNSASERNAKAKVKGGINRQSNTEPVVRGWLAEVGNAEPRSAILKIDQKHSFEFVCSTYRADLEKNKINSGRHAFEFVVPLEYVDGKKHTAELIDKQTGKSIATSEAVWAQNRRFNDFSGFLADSLVSPVVSAPFREEDKRCFAIMENIAKYLVGQSAKIEKDALVSVVMPVHNRAKTVVAAVESVLNQSYENIELIIVDDGSTDGSHLLIEAMNDPRIVLLRETQCGGVSAARNKGLKVAAGKYIAYLDSDNTWDLRYIAAMVGAFVENPDADAAYSGQLLYRGLENSPFAARFGSFNKSLLANRNYIDLNAFVHTRALYQQVGGFDQTLRRYVDWDLIMRMAEEGVMYSVPVLLSNYFYDKAENTITNDATFAHHIDIVRARQKERVERRKARAGAEAQPLKKSVTVVIPSYEALEDIKECIDSVLTSNGKELIKIVVVDNASSGPVVEYLSKLAADGVIDFISNKINYGFTYAVNQGIRAAEADSDIIFLNNDAIMTSDAIRAMQDAAYTIADAGLIVPQQVLPGDTKTIVDHVPFANPKFDCDVNLSIHHENIVNSRIFHDGRVTELSFAPFFCVYIKRDVLDRSLGLDAEFGRHYRSDRIYCDYIRHVMGLRIFHVAAAEVFHKLQKATDQLRKTEDRGDDFTLMFRKNKWDEQMARSLGYRSAAWDL